MIQLSKFFSILIIIFLSSCAQVPSINREVASETSSCLKLTQQFFQANQTTSLTANLDDKLFAIHLTDYLPEDGIIEANSFDRPRFAATIHFSLGEPVISHADGNWKNKKYSILVPIKYIKDQMVNIFVQDTFVIGSVQLPKEAIILIPTGVAKPKGFKGKVVTYENMQIEEATKKLIKEEGGIEINAGAASPEPEFIIQGETATPQTVFKKYFDADKDLTYDLHANTIYGDLDVGIYSILGDWFYRQISYQRASASYLEAKTIVFQETIHFIDQQVKKLNLSQVALNNYTKNREALYAQLNIMEAEIELQRKHKKTFLRGEIMRDEIWENRNDKKQLWKIINNSLAEFKAVDPDLDVKISILDIVQGMKKLDYNSLKRALSRPGVFSKEDTFPIHSELLLAAFKDFQNKNLSFEQVAKEFELAAKSATQDYQFSALETMIKNVESESLRKRLVQDPEVNQIIKDYKLRKEDRTL